MNWQGSPIITPMCAETAWARVDVTRQTAKDTSEATFEVRLREKEHTRTHETQVDWLSEWMWHAFFLCMKMSYVCSLADAHTSSGNVDAIAVCNTLHTPVLTFFFRCL